MTRRLKLVLGAVLLILSFMSAITYAGERPISMRWNGTVVDTAIDLNGDGFLANVIDAQAKGSFGARSLDIFTEFALAGICDEKPNVLYVSMWYSKPVTTFANGDLLWGSVTNGWMCMDITTGDFTGEAEGLYEGGTGRFAGATGSFVAPFSGKSLTISELGINFGPVAGRLEGTVVLDNDDDSDDDSDSDSDDD